MLLCACTWGSYAEGDNLLRLCSPGKNIEVCVDTDEGRLVYSVKKGKVEVLEASRLGLVVDGKDLGRNVSLAAEPEVEKLQDGIPSVRTSCHGVGQSGGSHVAVVGRWGALRPCGPGV